MRLHERYFIVKAADAELNDFMNALEKKHGLTYGEMFGLLAHRMASDAKYMVRQERHGDDSDKRGDEA